MILMRVRTQLVRKAGERRAASLWPPWPGTSHRRGQLTQPGSVREEGQAVLASDSRSRGPRSWIPLPRPRHRLLSARWFHPACPEMLLGTGQRAFPCEEGARSESLPPPDLCTRPPFWVLTCARTHQAACPRCNLSTVFQGVWARKTAMTETQATTIPRPSPQARGESLNTFQEEVEINHVFAVLSVAARTPVTMPSSLP